MKLRGWDYTGRNVGYDLHIQFKKMIDALLNPAFVNHRTWGASIQDDVAKAIGVSSSGAVRTIKKMCVMLGFINADALTQHEEIGEKTILTKCGEALYAITKLEQQILSDTNLDAKKVEAAKKEIKKLYEELYCEALMGG